MKILVAEDDFASALVLEKALAKEGYEVAVCQNGRLAQDRLKREAFDLLLTDWMMPEIDGLTLIRWARQSLDPVPAIAMLTVITNPEARAHAFLAGADEFIGKPYMLEELLSAVRTLLARRVQVKPDKTGPIGNLVSGPSDEPVAVVIGAGTGGPELLGNLFTNLSQTCFENAYFMVVQHGPDWLLYDLANRLCEEHGLDVHLAEPGDRPRAGRIYLAHGEHHLVLSPEPTRIDFSDAPPENFMRPSVDVLFRSAAGTVGERCIGIVFSGIGCDGALGAARLAGAGGVVLVQDPDTAEADTMPRAVLDMDLEAHSVDPSELPGLLSQSLKKDARR
ncbi:MAG: chemotaxis protein CheB [Vulcanimicrobiota bacterium]